VGRQETGRSQQIVPDPTQAVRPVAGPVQKLRQRAVRLEYLTVAWNIVEALVALTAGWLASSIALEGFGLDSIVETLSGLTLLWRFKQRQLDERRAEARAVRLIGVSFFLLAGFVGYEAITDLRLRRAPQFSRPGLILAALSLVAMLALGSAKRQTARELSSPALAADGLETLTCSYLSATLLISLALNGWRGWWWADPVAALGMAVFMIREGLEAFKSEPT
jgi:divalent metal cation (Fe/Co/Zn/Cd) transporter